MVYPFPIPTKRLRFRFGLRSVFALVTIICIWLAYSMNWIQQRRSIRTMRGVSSYEADHLIHYAPGCLWLLGERAYETIIFAEGDSYYLDRAKLLYPEAKIFHDVPGATPRHWEWKPDK